MIYLDFFGSLIVVLYSIVIKFLYEKEIYLPPWLSFLNEIFLFIIEVLIIQHQLEEMFPKIIFEYEDYKKTKETICQKIIKILLFVFLICQILFLFFISFLYITNFSNPNGFFYLQMCRCVWVFITITLFFYEGFKDFSGHSYTEFFQSQNQREVPFSFLPRTLVPEIMEIYKQEFYLPD